MKLRTAILAGSLVLNVVLGCALVYALADGTPEIKNGRYGVIRADIAVGRFGKTDVLLKLPKGLVVRDASASGADWFEPKRFRLVITSERELVDYSIDQKEAEAKNGEYYSADVQVVKRK